MRPLRIALALVVFASHQLFGEPPRPANARDVSSDEVEKILKENPKAVVLDVRTADEFKAGHIKGALNVDFFDDGFAKRVAALDPATPIIVHCAAGGRSAQSLPFLKDKQAVYHLKEGFKGWEKAGKPVEK